MATIRLITEREFRASRYGQIADQIEGDLSEVIAQAEAHIESMLDRTLSETTYTEMHRPTGDRLFLRHRPVTLLTSVQRRTNHHADWETLDNAHFEVQPNGAAGVLFSIDDEIADYEIQVVYKAGYAAIPWNLKAAVILQTVLFAYQDLEAYGQGDSKEPGLEYMERQIKHFIGPFKKVKVF